MLNVMRGCVGLVALCFALMGQAQDFEVIKRAAEQGNAEVRYGAGVLQYGLGKMYSEGRGVPRDDAEALKWYRKSAEQGDTGALLALKDMAEQGNENARKAHKAIVEALKRAAERGDAKAQYDLGNMYYYSEGMAQSNADAAKWWRKSAEQGYENAWWVLKNVAEKEDWYKNEDAQRAFRAMLKARKRAAERGDAKAQYDLGTMYRYAVGGVAQDYAKAANWLRKSAKQGYAKAQFELGNMYGEGQGVTQNHAEAVKWYRKAAEQGNIWGQYTLAWRYELGQGVAQDYAEAMKWYAQAAKQVRQERWGDKFLQASAQYALGAMYADGRGVAKNLAEAVKWWSKSAWEGLFFLNEGGNSAREALERVAEQGNEDAQKALKALKEKAEMMKEILEIIAEREGC